MQVLLRDGTWRTVSAYHELTEDEMHVITL